MRITHFTGVDNTAFTSMSEPNPLPGLGPCTHSLVLSGPGCVVPRSSVEMRKYGLKDFHFFCWVCRDGVDFVDDAFLFATYSPPQQLINRYNEVRRTASFVVVSVYHVRSCRCSQYGEWFSLTIMPAPCHNRPCSAFLFRSSSTRVT